MDMMDHGNVLGYDALKHFTIISLHRSKFVHFQIFPPACFYVCAFLCIFFAFSFCLTLAKAI